MQPVAKVLTLSQTMRVVAFACLAARELADQPINPEDEFEIDAEIAEALLPQEMMISPFACAISRRSVDESICRTAVVNRRTGLVHLSSALAISRINHSKELLFMSHPMTPTKTWLVPTELHSQPLGIEDYVQKV